ncbi:MAG: nickel pincer cofactor biosynthesis protein LarC [Thermodesulfobacteriota bacterium]
MIAYFDCFSGISGDMTLGALVDLGVSAQWIQEMIRTKLGLTGFDLSVSTEWRAGIAGKKVDVHVDDNTERDYGQIRQMIAQSQLPAPVMQNSLAMFERLAVAESGIHGCAVDAVHFHELGGVDAIVDIVGAALGIYYLDIDTVVASKIALGSGTVTCRHGRLPVPAPATLAVLDNVPVYGTDAGCELVTPTGAAIITSLADTFDVLPDMVIEKTGYGAGQRDLYPRANLLRVMVGTAAGGQTEAVEVVETAIDDMNPEMFGYLTERLIEDGAVDVSLMPVYMKKGRPGTFLQVLCHRSNRQAAVSRILNETTAIGIRHYAVNRQVLSRWQENVSTEYGTVAAKRVRLPNGRTRLAPEYEACKAVAQEKGVPIGDVYAAVMRQAENPS